MNTQAIATLDISEFKHTHAPVGLGFEQVIVSAEFVNDTLNITKTINILGVGYLEKTTLIVSANSAVLEKKENGEIRELLKHKFSTGDFNFALLDAISLEAKQSGPVAIFEHLLVY